MMFFSWYFSVPYLQYVRLHEPAGHVRIQKDFKFRVTYFLQLRPRYIDRFVVRQSATACQSPRRFFRMGAFHFGAERASTIVKNLSTCCIVERGNNDQ